jgi:hypothetical protein
VGGVRFAGQKPALDALYNVAAKVGCSGGVDKVFSELSDELVTQVLRDWQVSLRLPFGHVSLPVRLHFVVRVWGENRNHTFRLGVRGCAVRQGGMEGLPEMHLVAWLCRGQA